MIFFKLYSPDDPTEGGGGENPPKKVDAPKDYQPLTPVDRKKWNDFLDYLQEQGIGGKTDLDKRDQTLGLNYLNKYNKENPDKAIDPKIIPFVQYEQYQLRKGDSFPGLKPEEFNYVRKELSSNPKYLERPVSDVDSWLGSLTSREYYPTSTRLGKDYNYEFGTNFEDYVRALGNPDLAEKYKVKKPS
jgi:hypothetical protein